MSVLSALALPIAAMLLVAPSAARADPVITRVDVGSFPISSVVVVSGAAGVDIAYASGATAPSEPGSPIKGDTKTQTVAALNRLAATLKSQGFSPADIVMMRVFLVGTPNTHGKMDFAGMMAGYSQFFGTTDQPNKPARTTVQVAALAAPGALVEIEAQAVRPHQ